MKLTEEMKTHGYIGNVRKRNSSEYDEESYKTYESELTLSEKNNKNEPHGPDSYMSKQENDNTSKSNTNERSNIETFVWLIGLVATLVVYINTKAGKENINRLITDCGRPSPIRYGLFIVDDQEGTKYGSNASIVCSEGYSSSQPETVCQSDGTWSSVYCHVTDCGKTLPAIEHGRLTLNKEQDSTYNAMVTVTCVPGYESSKKRVTCQEDGRWEGALCEPVDCGKTLPAIEHGRLTLNKEQDSTYNAMVTVTCVPGYESSKKRGTCQEDGRWEGAICEPVDCGKTLPAIEHGRLTLNKGQDSTYNAMVTVTCVPGYESSKKRVTCQKDGRWEGAICQPVDCGKTLPAIEHGRLTLNKGQDSTYNAMVTVTCVPGYESSKKRVTCQKDGRWEGAICQPVDCGKTLPAIEHGRLTLNKEQDSTYNAMVTVTCVPGYESSKKRVTCQKDGRWEGAICQPVDCDKTLPAIEHGRLTLNKEQDSTYNAMATLTCAPGYESSKKSVTCQEDRRWEGAICEPVDCGKTLPLIENGQLTLNKEQDSTYTAMATVTCFRGYQSRKERVMCQRYRRWEEAICEPVDCGKPDMKHGKLEFVKTTYMSEASVKCETGYAPSQPNIKCTATGLWQDAHCYNIDDCSPNPCLNKGVCVDKVADYSCQCPQWFSGKTCQIDNQPCKNHQCRNFGECMNNPDGSYKCKCLDGVDGNFCERPHSQAVVERLEILKRSIHV